MGKLIICNKEVADVDQLVNWHESGWDATIMSCVQAENITTGLPCTTAFSPTAKNHNAFRFSRRPGFPKDQLPPLDAMQATIKQFVIHHDGLAYAAETFHTLQNERGLSCHFIIDNDGTIYQTLDLGWCAFHASQYNPISIGVEICNRGNWDAPIGKDGAYYDFARKQHPDKKMPKRRGEHDEEVYCTAHGSKLRCYDFTDEQYQSMHNLAHALTKALPNIALDYPQDVPGHVLRTVLNPLGGASLDGNAWSYSGYIGHLHLTKRKWDPGPFDFKGFIDKLRGSLCFPVWTGKIDDTAGAKPVIPDNEDDLEKDTALLYQANEERAQAGYYPVGPWGDSRLWHGGVHIPGHSNKPENVYAPFPGRIVLARMGKDSAVGSVNFVLLRHDMTVGPDRLRFFSLYMHLEDETKEATPVPPWMSKDTWKKVGKKGEVVVMDEPVEAGEIIGRIGMAGPSDDQKRQIHFEIFSKDLLVDEKSTKWVVRDGSAGGRFCEISDINDPIDTNPKDGILSKQELTDFFSGGGDRQSLRQLVVYSLSEWTFDPDWGESLRTPDDFRSISPDQIDALVEDQITPGLWWDDEAALAAHLPRDGFVYHYHPLTFLQWVNEQILEAASEPSDDATATLATKEEQKQVSSDFDGNGDDTDMFSQDVVDGNMANNDLYDLSNMVEGYDGDPEAE